LGRIVEVDASVFYVIHNIAELDPPIACYAAVVFGHSHRPSIAARALPYRAGN